MTDKCPICGGPYSPNNESIDELVTEKRDELEELHQRFMIDGVCNCPICLSMRSMYPVIR